MIHEDNMDIFYFRSNPLFGTFSRLHPGLVTVECLEKDQIKKNSH